MVIFAEHLTNLNTQHGSTNRYQLILDSMIHDHDFSAAI